MSEEEIGRNYEYKTVTDNRRHIEDRQALDEAMRDQFPFTFQAQHFTKAILKTEDDLVQLHRCPVCRYMVAEADIVWARQPTTLGEDGEIKSCRFCVSAPTI